MCGYFCTEYINFMLTGKTLTDFIKLFLKNDDIILNYFMINV